MANNSDEVQIVRGTDVEIPVAFKDENGAAINLTSSTVFFTVKENVSQVDATDANALIKKTITVHTDPTAGITTVVLTDTDTNIEAGGYYYDLKIKTSGGLLYNILSGIFTVFQNVTQRST